MDNIQNYKTLTGLTFEELTQKLDEELPPDAYKPVPGGADLTDIDPNHMRKILNQVFGMCGIGWGYSYEPADLTIRCEVRKTRDGKDRRVFIASLKRIRFWYKLTGSATTFVCDVYASGGSENDVEAYAMSGAITNALGKAVSNLGFQESVYLGKRSHHNVRKPKKTAAKPAAPRTPVQTPVPQDDEILDEIVEEPADNPIVTPKVDALSPDEAANLVITKEMTKRPERVGQNLGAQPLEAIEWWANKMKPANEAQKRLQSAARVLYKVRSNGHHPVAV
ncbi:MAG: hypothetical protein HRF47_10110 [Chloroflexota bacterium]